MRIYVDSMVGAIDLKEVSAISPIQQTPSFASFSIHMKTGIHIPFHLDREEEDNVERYVVDVVAIRKNVLRAWISFKEKRDVKIIEI